MEVEGSDTQGTADGNAGTRHGREAHTSRMGAQLRGGGRGGNEGLNRLIVKEMKYIIIYLAGYIFSGVYFGVRCFREYQKSYPSIAADYREHDISFGILMGMVKGIAWPIILPLDILIRLFI